MDMPGHLIRHIASFCDLDSRRALGVFDKVVIPRHLQEFRFRPVTVEGRSAWVRLPLPDYRAQIGCRTWSDMYLNVHEAWWVEQHEMTPVFAMPDPRGLLPRPSKRA